jgi:hypothetical protein
MRGVVTSKCKGTDLVLSRVVVVVAVVVIVYVVVGGSVVCFVCDRDQSWPYMQAFVAIVIVTAKVRGW